MSNDVLKNLDWDIQPERDLWPDIQAGIRFRKQEKRVFQHWMPVAIAACLMLAVGAFVMSTLSYRQAQQTYDMQAQYIEYQKAQIAMMEQQHAKVRAQFVAFLDGDMGPVNQQTVAEVREVLMTFDTASTELKAAILAQPMNTTYTTMLVNNYQKELELLTEFKQANGLSI